MDVLIDQVMSGSLHLERGLELTEGLRPVEAKALRVRPWSTGPVALPRSLGDHLADSGVRSIPGNLAELDAGSLLAIPVTHDPPPQRSHDLQDRDRLTPA